MPATPPCTTRKQTPHTATSHTASIRRLTTRHLAVATILSATLAATAFAQELLATETTAADQSSLAVTIYNDNLGLVREERTVKLNKGLIELNFRDVASEIDTTTVHIRSQNAAGKLNVLEQNYEYDLITPEKLLEKFVGSDVTLYGFDDGKETERKKARLLATNNGLIYESGGEILVNPPMQVILPNVPKDLAARPTLKWLVNNQHDGAHKLETSYLTGGMGWRADYVAVLADDEKSLDLDAWVTLNNNSGTTYRNAKLKLLAGAVNRVAPAPTRGYAKRANMEAMAMAADMAPPQFEERTFFEYHLYELQRPTTIKNNQNKQVALFDASGVKLKKEYELETFGLYGDRYGDKQKHKVNVKLIFKNSKDNQLGIPVPAGVVRVFKADKDGTLQLAGEDRVEHTPRDEEIKLQLGAAFDVVGERKQTSFKRLGDRAYEETNEVRVRNRKDETITVKVPCQVYGDYEVRNASHKFTADSSRRIVFDLPVKPGEEAILTYTILVRH